MKKYRIAFCGCGSIAKRHIGNLAEIFSAGGDAFEIDLIRHAGRTADADIKELVSHVYSVEDRIQGEYDAVFVTNPTSMHYSTIVKYAKYTDNFFIEKPIFDNTELRLDDISFRNKVIYVACPLRYSGVLQYIKNNISYRKAYSVRATSSSYLPDWRAGVDYRKTYSAKRQLGGGVSIDLIHEWDYLTHLFGFPEKAYSIIDKKSDLEIDSDDIAIYISRYKDKTVELHLDYFGRKTIRTLELFMPDETIVGDFAASEIRFLKTGKVIKIEEQRNDYQKRELNHFLDIMHRRTTNDSTWSDAVKVLKLAKGESR